jgi:hypothetical protein
MFGQRAGGVHDMEDQDREHMGQRHAWPSSAPLGQGGQDRAETLAESGLKTGGNHRRGVGVAGNRLLFMLLCAIRRWTNTDLPSDFPKSINLKPVLHVSARMKGKVRMATLWNIGNDEAKGFAVEWHERHRTKIKEAVLPALRPQERTELPAPASAVSLRPPHPGAARPTSIPAASSCLGKGPRDGIRARGHWWGFLLLKQVRKPRRGVRTQLEAALSLGPPAERLPRPA